MKKSGGGKIHPIIRDLLTLRITPYLPDEYLVKSDKSSTVNMGISMLITPRRAPRHYERMTLNELGEELIEHIENHHGGELLGSIGQLSIKCRYLGRDIVVSGMINQLVQRVNDLRGDQPIRLEEFIYLIFALEFVDLLERNVRKGKPTGTFDQTYAMLQEIGVSKDIETYIHELMVGNPTALGGEHITIDYSGESLTDGRGITIKTGDWIEVKYPPSSIGGFTMVPVSKGRVTGIEEGDEYIIIEFLSQLYPGNTEEVETEYCTMKDVTSINGKDVRNIKKVPRWHVKEPEFYLQQIKAELQNVQ